MVKEFHAGFLPDFLDHSSKFFVSLLQVPWIQKARGENKPCFFYPAMPLCSHHGRCPPSGTWMGVWTSEGSPLPPGSPRQGHTHFLYSAHSEPSDGEPLHSTVGTTMLLWNPRPVIARTCPTLPHQYLLLPHCSQPRVPNLASILEDSD